MNLAHVHLLLNHFPTVGMVVGVGLFLGGLLQRNDEIKKASLIVFLGLALLAIPTYMSGNAAQAALDESKVSKAAIEAHEGAALIAFGGIEFVGAFAWLGLWQHRRIARMPGFTLTAVLLLSVLTLVLMTRTAMIGAQIRHPEIGAAAPGEPLAREAGTWVQAVRWVWPTCETLHFVGLCLLFGVAAMVDLRVLGLMRGIPYQSLHRLLPWGVLGFGVNLITGMMFFIAEPGQYLMGDFFTKKGAFQWKMALIVLAGVNVLYFTIFDEVWTLRAGEDAPFRAKTVAFSALVIVFAVLFCGRMLPFLGSAF